MNQLMSKFYNIIVDVPKQVTAIENANGSILSRCDSFVDVYDQTQTQQNPFYLGIYFLLK